MRTLLLSLLLVAPTAGPADERATLRAEYASQFLTPEAHLWLSKYLNDRGERLTAFFVSEAARREYFEEEPFDRAFRAVFRDDHFDNSAAAEKKLKAEVDAAPEDAAKRARLADIFLSRREWKRAEKELRKLIVLTDAYTDVEALRQVLISDGRDAEGDALIRTWMEKHPKSVEALRERIESLIRGHSPDLDKALAAAEAALAEHPDDASLHFLSASALRDNDAAGKQYARAAELAPDSAYIQGWTARYFLKVLKDDARALEYYLNAYFNDPHFRDTEYAESRIRSLAMTMAAARTETLRSGGVAKRLTDADPVVVGLALEEADGAWRNEYADTVIALLAHDDPNVRALAAKALGGHLQPDDPRVDRLLEDPDLRVRGPAAYVAGALRGEKIVPLMTSWLEHPADLIRYDAISVLAINGGTVGRAVLMKLRSSGKVTEPRLKAMLDMVAQQH
jgi:hypothetical protein